MAGPRLQERKLPLVLALEMTGGGAWANVEALPHKGLMRTGQCRFLRLWA